VKVRNTITGWVWEEGIRRNGLTKGVSWVRILGFGKFQGPFRKAFSLIPSKLGVGKRVGILFGLIHWHFLLGIGSSFHKGGPI